MRQWWEFRDRLVPVWMGAGTMLLCLVLCLALCFGLTACQVQRSNPLAGNFAATAMGGVPGGANGSVNSSDTGDGAGADPRADTGIEAEAAIPDDGSSAKAYARFMDQSDKVTISFDYWNAGYTQSRMLRLSGFSESNTGGSDTGESNRGGAKSNPDEIKISVRQIRSILLQMKKAGYFEQAKLGGGDFPPDGPRIAIRVEMAGGPRFSQIRQVDDSTFVWVHWVSQFVAEAVKQRVHQFARQAHDLSDPRKNRALAEARQEEIQKAVLRAFAQLKTPNRVRTTLPVGRKHGLVAGQAFMVHQGNRVLGHVRFVQVLETRSIVIITPRKTKKDTPAIIADLMIRQAGDS